MENQYTRRKQFLLSYSLYRNILSFKYTDSLSLSVRINGHFPGEAKDAGLSLLTDISVSVVVTADYLFLLKYYYWLKAIFHDNLDKPVPESIHSGFCCS